MLRRAAPSLATRLSNAKATAAIAMTVPSWREGGGLVLDDDASHGGADETVNHYNHRRYDESHEPTSTSDSVKPSCWNVTTDSLKPRTFCNPSICP
jgi:hypothetical protein